MKHWLRMLWQDEQGQDLTEYALLLVLMALAAVAFVPDLAQAVNDVFQDASDCLGDTTGACGAGGSGSGSGSAP